MAAFGQLVRSGHQCLCACRDAILTSSVRYNSNRCLVTRVKRKVYLRQYPTMLVQPDGSTFTIRYNAPRKIIKLPLDINTLSEEEREKRIKMRKPKKKLKIVEDIDDNFDFNKYKHLWKK